MWTTRILDVVVLVLFWQGRMSNNVSIHFKCQGRMYGLMLKTSVEEITMSMVEARVYKKLGLDESKVKLQLSYIPLLVGCEEQSNICDDEDMFVYLTHVDKENRRCVLYVEVMTTSELPEQQSRAGKSSFGMNYDDVHRDDDEIGEIGPNALTLYVDNGQAKQQEGVRVEVDDDDTSRDRYEDNDRDTSGMLDEYVEAPAVVESSQFLQPWEDGLGVSKGQEFPNKKAISELVDRVAFVNSFGYALCHSDTTRWVVKCSIPRCKWGLRATRIQNTDIFSIRTYTKMHTCNRASQSTSSDKRRGSAQLVASYLNDEYPGKLETPTPKVIIELVKRDFGVDISYSTALRGKNLAVCNLRGSPEESYKMLHCYLFVLRERNPGTITSVELDGAGKFKYLFIALGPSIEGFQVMRKVLIVDATFIKNGYGGVLVFASAQDPNRHNYPIAFGVLDGENNSSWTWFFETLKTVVPDSSELVFVSDRNVSLINAIANVYPAAHHGHCLWHLAQNVKGHASNGNKSVVAFRFMECGTAYTVAEFNMLYESFKTRYPSAAIYVEASTKKEQWARSFFPGKRYNLDTSNSVESLNNTFKDARRYSLIPMLDTIIRKISDWFNEHRKEAVSGSIDNKLVPLVENFMHDKWPLAEKLNVREINSYELEYEIDGEDAKLYLVNLVLKTCSCGFFDYQKYPCVHALAAFITFSKHVNIGGGRGRATQIELHELCSKYYWTEMWVMAYCRSIYVVPAMSSWEVPDYIKEQQIIPKDRIIKKGRNRVVRFPSAGERRKPRTQNKRRSRALPWLLFGDM